MADPIHQFQIQKVIDLPDVTLPVLGVVDLAITNSHIAMTAAFVVIVGFLAAVTSNAKIVPGRLQSAGEGMFGLIDNLADSIIGHEGRKYFPFVFTLFTLILGMNILGLFLTFTATSQLAITITFALITFGLVLVVGFAKNGLGFFKLFWPMGAPLALRPVVGLIEFVSFLLRPVTLALRLFGNMLGGHVALKVFAGFVVSLVLIFKKKPSAPLTLAYAGLEGLFVGGISAIFEQIAPGVATQAVIATFVIIGVVLALFRSGKIRASKRATKVFMIAIIGYALFSLINLGLIVFGVNSDPWGLRGGEIFGIPVALLLGVLVILLASYSLVLDFDSIQQGVRRGAPAAFGWTAAFGIMVTVVWLYVEILRMLAILRGGE